MERIAGIAREIVATKCTDPPCSRRNTTFRLTQGTLCARRKNEGGARRDATEKYRAGREGGRGSENEDGRTTGWRKGREGARKRDRAGVRVREGEEERTRDDCVVQ